MRRLTLQLVAANIIFALIVAASAVWVISHFSLGEKQEKQRSYKTSPSASTDLSEIPTVAFCDLIAHPTDYNQKVVRTQADLFSYYADIILSDPSSCVLPHPMVGVELDTSFHYDPSDNAQKEVYDLLRTEGERGYARFHVAIIVRFEEPSFPKPRNKITGKYYPYRFTIMRLEKAEIVIQETNNSAGK
jgi:hypothetical protein